MTLTLCDLALAAAAILAFGYLAFAILGLP